MSDDRNLKLGIDAAGAKQGADTYSSALKQIERDVNALDKATDVSFTKIKERLKGIDFKSVAQGMSSLSNIKIDPNLGSSLRNLSTALNNFKGPNAAAVTQTRGLSRALDLMKVPSSALIARIDALSNAMKNFRAPSAQQTANFNSFVSSLNNARISANTATIISALNNISTAAQNTRNALSGIGNTNVNVPRGLRGWSGAGGAARGGGGGGGGGGQYGPRPYDGVFSGSHRATGELRGFENVANPSFQGASVLRAMLPALTSGEMFKSLYEEGTKLTQFQHVLEVATTVPDNAVKSQENLTQAMQFATDVSMKYGLNLTTVREGFSSFAAAMHISGFSMAETQKVYDNASSSIRALGVDVSKQPQIWRALDTAIAQNNVSMIQLHRQIDPVLPGFQAELARTVYRDQHHMDQSTPLDDKQLGDAEKNLTALSAKKQILPEALFKTFENFKNQTAPGLATALTSPTAAVERFKTAWTTTEDAMNKNGVWDAMGKEMDHMAKILGSNDVQMMFMHIAQGIAVAIHDMGSAVQWAADHMDILIPAFKLFLGLGAVETILRIGQAFGGTTTLITGMIAPLGTATAGLKSFMAAQSANAAAKAASAAAASTLAFGGAQVANGWTAGQAAAAAAAASATSTSLLATVGAAVTTLGEVVVGFLLSPVTLVAAAFATAFATIGGILYIGRNDVIAYGNSTITAGDVTKTVWLNVVETLADAVKSIGSGFSSLWSGMKSGFTSAFGWLGEKTQGWAELTLQSIAFVTSAFQNVAQFMLHPINAWGAVLNGNKDGTFVSPEQKYQQWLAQSDARKKSEQAQRDAMRSAQSYEDGLPGAFPPDSDNKVHPLIGAATPKKGKSDAEKAQDQLDSMLKGLNPGAAMMEKFAEEQATLDKARAMGVQSKGGKMMGMSPQEEYAIDQQAINDKVLESIGGMTAQQKAMREAEQTQLKLNAAVKIYAATQGQAGITQAKATELMNEFTKAHKASLTPYEDAISKITKENSLLALGSREREVQTQLEADLKKIRDTTGKDPNEEQKQSLENLIRLHQQLQQASANQNVGIQAWANSFQDLNTELGKVEQKIAGELTDAMTKFIEGPKAFIQGGGFKALAKSLTNDITKTMVQGGMREMTDGLGLTNGPNADPHGSMILGPIAQMLGITKKPSSGDAANANPLKNAMTPDQSALYVHVVNGGGGTAGGGKSGIAGSGIGSSGGDSGGGASGGGGGGSSGSSSAAGAGSNMVDTSSWGTGGSSKGMGMGGAGMIPGSGSSSSGTNVLGNIPGAAGKLLGNNSLTGGGGELFGKTGIFGSAGPFSAEGLMGSKGPIFGSQSFFGAGGFNDKQMGKDSLLGSQGLIGSLFSKAAGAAGGSGAAGAAGASGAAGSAASNLTYGPDGASTMLGGAWDSVTDWIGNTASSIGSGISSAASGISSFVGGLFSEGGYSTDPVSRATHPASSWANAPHYAEGTPNTSGGGMPSILHPNEAVIPLSRGRKIPVQMGNSAGAGGSNPVNVTFHVNTPDADSFRKSQTQINTTLGASIQRSMKRNG